MLSELEVLEGFDIKPLDEKEFADEMKILKERKFEFQEGNGIAYSDSEFDKASVLIIDYDLFKISNDGPISFLTGETVSYLTRCFSKCDLIIGLNQFGKNDFDLSMKGNLESYADLNIGGIQLKNKGLWSVEREGFRPSHWIQLIDYLDDFQKKKDDIGGNIKKPIFKILGIPDVIAEILPPSVTDFIGNDPLIATFKDFVTKSGNGLSVKDSEEKAVEKITKETVCIIGAARISKWLERCLLLGQNFLVDAPHLVSRFPSLLKGDHSKVETWNKSCRLGSHKKLGIKHGPIEKSRYQKDFWISRPLWSWKSVSENDEIQEVRDPWEKEQSKFVFCEDATRFYEKGVCTAFEAELESPYIHRYVKRFKTVEYRPMYRLM